MGRHWHVTDPQDIEIRSYSRHGLSQLETTLKQFGIGSDNSTTLFFNFLYLYVLAGPISYMIAEIYRRNVDQMYGRGNQVCIVMVVSSE